MSCGKKNPICMLICILVVVGSLNWGLVGLGWLIGGQDWNVVHMLLGQWLQVEAVVYVLVGVAGLMKLMCAFKGCKSCGTGGCGCGAASCSCGKPGCPVCSKKM